LSNFFYLINIQVYLMSDRNLDFEKHVKIYSNNDETRLEHLGSVFHNKKSRKMWILLSNNPDREYHLKEMVILLEGIKEEPDLPIYGYHVKAMVKSGIVVTSQKKCTTNTLQHFIVQHHLL